MRELRQGRNVYMPLLSEESSDRISEQSPESTPAQWLDKASDAQILQLLGSLPASRPGILQRAGLRRFDESPLGSSVQAAVEELAASANDESCQLSQPGLSPCVSDGWQLPRRVGKTAPIVQFSAFVYVAEESDGEISVDVLRLGDQSEASTVRWTTKDVTAKAGVTYEAASGMLHFGPDEGSKLITVKLLPNDTWSPVLDFAIEILAAGLENAELARYGSKARVKVADKDVFPSNEFVALTDLQDEQSPHEQLQQFSKTRLFTEYCKLNFWSNSGVRSGTIKQLLLDQLHNLNKLKNLFLRVYLVDCILAHSFAEDNLLLVHDRRTSLFLVTAAAMVPFAILHALDYLSLGWGIEGGSRLWIQSAVLRRYLNYSAESRSQIRHSDMDAALNHDASRIASEGYCEMLNMVAKHGTLFVLLVFQFTSPFVFGTPFRLTPIIPLVVFPVILLIFLWIRGPITERALGDESRAMSGIISNVEFTVSNFRLISDYSKRCAVVDKFREAAQEYNGIACSQKKVMTNNTYFCKWVSQSLIALWVAVGGLEVLAGKLSFGLFLCDIQIFKTMGEITQQLYQSVINMQSIGPSLDGIVVLLNLPTDLHDRKVKQQQLREATSVMRSRIQKNHATDIRVDLLPIFLQDVTYSYVARDPDGRGPCRRVTVAVKGKIAIQQGTMVALIGSHGSGKSTRLKVLGGAILPGIDNLDGFFIPSHLRVLHIDTEPMFIPGTLLDNLVFGVHEGDPDASEERVIGICKSLQLSHKVMKLILDKRHLDWNAVVSISERQKLALARAIIANPDVLAMHRPMFLFDDQTADAVAALFKRFVQERGIRQDPTRFHSRRPRTCVFSCTSRQGLHACHKIYEVSLQGVREMKLEDALLFVDRPNSLSQPNSPVRGARGGC